jgi:hypothetical protein
MAKGIAAYRMRYVKAPNDLWGNAMQRAKRENTTLPERLRTWLDAYGNEDEGMVAAAELVAVMGTHKRIRGIVTPVQCFRCPDAVWDKAMERAQSEGIGLSELIRMWLDLYGDDGTDVSDELTRIAGRLNDVRKRVTNKTVRKTGQLT